MKQQARCKWVDLGDQNTKYFYKLVKQKNVRNYISQLTLSSGEISSDRTVITNEILNHYKYLLGLLQREEFLLTEVCSNKKLSLKLIMRVVQ